MNAYILPGNSPRHQQWEDELQQVLEAKGNRVVAQRYRHWQTGEQWADIDVELMEAEKHTTALAPYTIVAKSIGTAIALKGVAEKKLAPQKLVLLGVPLALAQEVGLKNWLASIVIPVMIIQNTHDPLGGFAEVSRYVGENPLITLIESPGDTHDYVDYERIAAYL